MDVHPPKNVINRYGSIPIYSKIVDHLITGCFFLKIRGSHWINNSADLQRRLLALMRRALISWLPLRRKEVLTRLKNTSAVVDHLHSMILVGGLFAETLIRMIWMIFRWASCYFLSVELSSWKICTQPARPDHYSDNEPVEGGKIGPTWSNLQPLWVKNMTALRTSFWVSRTSETALLSVSRQAI
jgi:hypothetical protein